MKKKVLIMAGYYLPSVKGGGPIQSVKNLVDNLSDKIDFYIVAADRDFGDEKSFSNIKTDEWISYGNAYVFYTDTSQLTWKKTNKIVHSIEYDALYLNSFFSYKFSMVPILLRKFNRLSNKPIIVAPRGQFAQSALDLKNEKKRFYIKIAKTMKFYDEIVWHATTETEKKNIEYIFGMKMKIRVANNLTANYKELMYDKKIDKMEGELKIVYISRIHPIKNIKKAIEFLKHVSGKIDFSIYGPLEDKIYWGECQNVIDGLPESITVSYKGIVDHNHVIDIFKENHVFLFPTLGESFGHVISEAMIGGCPVILSDQTPWRGLEEKQVGWDIELADEDRFVEVLQYCTDLSSEEYYRLSKNTFDYGKKMSSKSNDIFKSYSLFE